MKSLYTYIGAVLAAASILASCDKNEPSKFNDKDAFVAFDKTSLTLSEGSEDVLKIPVTLASVAGLEETIKFEVKEPEKKAAKQGVNFELLTKSGTLSFNAENRTRYIEVKAIPDGEYTGDLQFSVVIYGTETIKLGSENTCTVTLNDVDHPLGFMLGAYTATGVSHFNGPSTWTMTFFKDADDDHKVWIDNLFQNDSFAGADTRYYGIVNEDLTSLNIPFGQESEYKYSNGNPITLLGFDGEYGHDTGSVDVAIVQDGDKVSLDFGTEWGFWVKIKDAGDLNVIYPGIKAVKN
jgi:hypothetical protein